MLHHAHADDAVVLRFDLGHEYNRYFEKIAEVLTSAGIGLVQCIGVNAGKNEHDPFVQKYIFPWSNQPRLSEMVGGPGAMEWLKPRMEWLKPRME